MTHILMDGTPTFWLDGHMDVLRRLLYKSFKFLSHTSALWWGMGENPILGRLMVEKSTFFSPNF